MSHDPITKEYQKQRRELARLLMDHPHDNKAEQRIAECMGEMMRLWMCHADVPDVA